jgi:CRP-like cAMP-binding protein
MNWAIFNWIGWEDWAGNFCYTILALSYLVTNMYWLRLLAVVALGLEGVYFYFGSDTPLWVGIGWNAVFVSINVVQLAILTREHMKVRFTAQEELLRRGLFAGLGSLDLSRLLKSGSWHDVKAGTELTSEGKAVTDVCVIADGLAKVEVGDRTISILQTGSFVGEMSLLTNEAASATVTAMSPCRVFVVSKEKLRALFEKSQELQSALTGIIGRDLAYKLKTASEPDTDLTAPQSTSDKRWH